MVGFGFPLNLSFGSVVAALIAGAVEFTRACMYLRVQILFSLSSATVH